MAFSRAQSRRRPWRALRPNAPLPALLYLSLCLAAALAWGWSSFRQVVDQPSVGWRVLLLAALAIAFEEGSARAARLRVRIGPDLSQDLTSVWSFGAAIAIAPGWTVVIVCVVLTYKWIRQYRPAGMQAFRWVFNTTNVVLTSLVAAWLFSHLTHAWSGLPGGMDGFLPVLVAMAAYAAVNRALVTVFLISRGVPVADLAGTRDENLIEFATLCLGGLVSLAVLFQPWLVVFVIAPMVALQRGARMREFETAASTDTKTGLLNAVAWEHVAKRELSRAQRLGSSLAVLIIDIDRFKLVNDEFGHLAGDKVLRVVGRSLAAGVREYDTVGRFGGEEFVAVLPDSGEADALVIAERLRARIHRLRVRSLLEAAGSADEPTVSVSVGVAVVHDERVELTDLLRAADAALYRAKAEGRNRVVLAEPGTGPADAPLPLA